MATNTQPSPDQTRTGVSSSQNYYDLLGITPQATDEEIRRAYRKTALRLHPDKNPDPEAAAQFHAVDKAYKILIDPKLRSTYDQLGPKAADAMRRMNEEYSEALAQMPRWKKILFAFLCISTCCCFGAGCCCLCGCGCCCNFCCNHCCGKYKREEDDVFSSFQENDDIPGIYTQRNVNGTSPTVIITSPQETDPVLGSTGEQTSVLMPPSYESISVGSQ
ncbi:unnamed protein product [Adineta ricciae]|uniref:J domain-containing protein n=1 Tax=Adineta ricciae TaxID=249248 RepID=A0A814FA27_ADIRI|nr:unnamed protein product [Adineta ricciae]CAF0978534.1 unnamed protein product [Adineta ricciae]